MSPPLFALRQQQAALVSRGDELHFAVAEQLARGRDAVLFKMRFELGQPCFHGAAAGVGEIGHIVGERARERSHGGEAGLHASSD